MPKLEVNKFMILMFLIIFQDVFQKFPTMLINVEIKEPSEVAVRKTEELIRKYQREHLTVFFLKGIQIYFFFRFGAQGILQILKI